jgi:hypothetical protein
MGNRQYFKIDFADHAFHPVLVDQVEKGTP